MITDTILLIPNPEGSTLLDDPCAPTMVRFLESDTSNRLWSLWYRQRGPGPPLPDTSQQALVLAESGKLQRHGCLTLAGAASAVVFAVVVAVVASVLVVPARAELLRAFVAEHYPGAHLVFLADGVEVTP